MNNGARLPFPDGDTASAGNTKLVSNIVGGPEQSMLPTATGTITGATPYRSDLKAANYLERLDNTPSNVTAATIAAVTTAFAAGQKICPNTGEPLRLRAVQASADIKVNFPGQLVQFSTTAGEFGFVTATMTAGTNQGLCTKPISNRYVIGYVIKQYDWFYVVEDGPCYCTVSNGQSVAAQGPVSLYSSVAISNYLNAGMIGPAAAGQAVLGTAEAAVTGNSSTYGTSIALVRVKAGLQASEA